MGLKVCRVEEVKIFDGKNERCRCDGVNMFIDFNNGAETSDNTTDANGLIPGNGHVCNALHNTAKIHFAKWAYKNVTVKVKVTWDGNGDFGDLGLQSINMVK